MHDGVTVHVPLKTLPQLRSTGFEWLVPALRAELVTALIRSIPKDMRKRLVPVPEIAAKVLENLTPRQKPLLEALAEEIEAQRGVRIPPDAWDLTRLPNHLKMTFSVEDDNGQDRRQRAGPRHAARAGPPQAASRARAGHEEARANRPDDVDVRHDPEGRRAARHRPDDPRLPVAGRRGRDRRPQGAGERGRAGAEHAGRHPQAAGADDRGPAAALQRLKARQRRQPRA